MKIEKLYCDICNKEIVATSGAITFTKKTFSPSARFDEFIVNNEICFECAKKINTFILNMREN